MHIFTEQSFHFQIHQIQFIIHRAQLENTNRKKNQSDNLNVTLNVNSTIRETEKKVQNQLRM